jgi:hypothetical protein
MHLTSTWRIYFVDHNTKTTTWNDPRLPSSLDANVPQHTNFAVFRPLPFDPLTDTFGTTDISQQSSSTSSVSTPNATPTTPISPQAATRSTTVAGWYMPFPTTGDRATSADPSITSTATPTRAQPIITQTPAEDLQVIVTAPGQNSNVGFDTPLDELGPPPPYSEHQQDSLEKNYGLDHVNRTTTSHDPEQDLEPAKASAPKLAPGDLKRGPEDRFEMYAEPTMGLNTNSSSNEGESGDLTVGNEQALNRLVPGSLQGTEAAHEPLNAGPTRTQSPGSVSSSPTSVNPSLRVADARPLLVSTLISKSKLVFNLTLSLTSTRRNPSRGSSRRNICALSIYFISPMK